MVININIILSQIDSTIEKWKNLKNQTEYDDYSDRPDEDISEVITLIDSTIDRLSPAGSRYKINCRTLIEKYGEDNGRCLGELIGVLKALRKDYEDGYLKTIQELIHADVFSDFLDMANYLLSEGYKDPAAVIIGGVLEEHLRKLCIKNNIPIIENNKNKKADKLNADLASANVYNILDQKSVTSWLDLRNKAAHGKYTEYVKEQVVLMLQGIMDFISRYSA